MENSLLISSLGACALGLTLLFSGCGGGGGSSNLFPTATPVVPQATTLSDPTAIPAPTGTATPAATTISGACNSRSFLPNYAPLSLPGDPDGDILLRRSGFPLRVFIAATDEATRALTVRGMERWADATANRVTYQLVSSSASADVNVRYGPIQESGVLGVTESTFNTVSFVIVSTDVTLDFEESVLSDIEKEYVVAHELGHALGIGLHSDVSNDLMFAAIRTRTPLPTTRDINTLRTAYCDAFPARNLNALRVAQNGPLKTVRFKLFKTGCTQHTRHPKFTPSG